MEIRLRYLSPLSWVSRNCNLVFSLNSKKYRLLSETIGRNAFNLPLGFANHNTSKFLGTRND